MEQGQSFIVSRTLDEQAGEQGEVSALASGRRVWACDDQSASSAASIGSFGSMSCGGALWLP